MAWAALPGSPLVMIGPGYNITSVPAASGGVTIDAANEAAIIIGRVITSDGGSHTIDTTGSSSLGWRTGAVTFANAGTTVKIGLAAVLTTAGPPGRAANAADVVTFDVNAAPVGGGGGISANAWIESVPTAGTKTIANGDLVAFAVQATARAGADSVVAVLSSSAATVLQRPIITGFTGGSYSLSSSQPNVIITFSDGTLGYFMGAEVFSTINTRTWNSGSATKEYGQLYQFPFPTKIYGIYGWIDPDADCDLVLYSDPLGGSPVPEKTLTFDANTMGSATGRKFIDTFAAPYFADAYEKVGAVFKPGGSNVSAYYKTLNAAGHRVTDPGIGTTGYGISRASGAFADANSSLDHYYIGLIVGAFQHGGRPQSVIGF